jgi:hypothetical protein
MAARTVGVTDPVVVAPDSEVRVREPKAMLDAVALQEPVSAKAGGAPIWTTRTTIQPSRVAIRRGLRRVPPRGVDRGVDRLTAKMAAITLRMASRLIVEQPTVRMCRRRLVRSICHAAAT